MSVQSSKTDGLQLDLLGVPVVRESAAALKVKAARPASMLPTASLYEDAHNPRTEITELELHEMACDIQQHGILQPIVVHPADATGRHQIHFGAKRWRAAQRIGLSEVPVVVREGPANPYAQVAENQKRQGLSPLDLARFIRGRIDAGDSSTQVSRKLGMDLTSVAHHLALLDLPPVLDAAMKAGRCTSPRTLYEMQKLHTVQPQSVAALVAGNEHITREAVAALREATTVAPTAPTAPAHGVPSPERGTQMLSRATVLCNQLDAVLERLHAADLAGVPAGDVAALRQRIARLAQHLAV